MRDELSYFDIGAIFSSLALFVGYHIHLYIVRPQYFGGKVPFAVNMKNADMWIMKHKDMNESPTILLAVQTFRNTMMAAVFIGGNAINFAYDLANDYHNVKEKPQQVRSLVIMTLMFASFLCWANVIRLCSVLGYMIGTMQYSKKLRAEALEREQHLHDKDELAKVDAHTSVDLSNMSSLDIESAGSVDPIRKRNSLPIHKHRHHGGTYSYNRETGSADAIPDIFHEASKILKMMTVYFSFGFRLMFVSIPFAFYSAGPLALVISSACLFLFLLSYDFVKHHHSIKY